MKRCGWCEKEEIYVKYHDEEWGVPVFDDNKQFEFLVLESAQAGLSWLTILKRRENYRMAFENFDPVKVACFDENKVEELMNNKGIIRNKRKIQAAVNNAKCFLKIQEEYGSFCNYIWGFVNGKPIVNTYESLEQVPAVTELSETISKDLKSRGFKFLGSTIVYAHMQAVGIVNDHLVGCFRYNQIKNS
ncbi:MAG: DNA-3-methyladenine glycosylase [Clostridiaceae bacterium]|jgi:DNA-3-methyladenine glycosylase I|nr:DNA-3-methyladenine glycosylase [Clostridiaceae bacterium]